EMAIAMALQGGIGIIQKNLDPVVQRTHVKRVKFYLNGFLEKARTMPPDATVAQRFAPKEEKGFGFNSFPIVHAGRRLLGVIPSRELKYNDRLEARLGDIMIPNPVTAPVGTTIEQAYYLMRQRRISIQPIVDEQGIFQGMYCF